MSAASVKNGRPLGRPCRAAMRRDVSPFPHRRNLVAPVVAALGSPHRTLKVTTEDAVVTRAGTGPRVAVDERSDVAVASVMLAGFTVTSDSRICHLKPPCSRNGDNPIIRLHSREVKPGAAVSGSGE